MSSKDKMHAWLENGQTCLLHLGNDGGSLEIPERNVLTSNALKREDVPAEQEIFLKLENGNSASLLHNYNKGCQSFMGGTHSIVLSEIGSNSVIIGPAKFGLGQTVKIIEAFPSNPELSVCYHKHRNHRHVSSSEQMPARDLLIPSHDFSDLIIDVIDTNKLNACKIQMQDAILSIDIAIFESFGSTGHGVKQKPRISIEYVTPVSLQQAQDDLHCVANFLSFVSGAVIRANEVHLYVPNHDQQYSDKFELHTPRPETHEGNNDKNGRWAILTLDRHQAAYIDALQKWFERRNAWKNSYNYFLQCLLLENSIGREHYLAALAWFESIPTFYLKNQEAIGKSAIRMAAQCAADKFAEMKFDVPKDRICNLLAPLNSPSLGARLRAATDHIKRRFGIAESFFLEDDTVKNIAKIRGQYAHGDIPEASFSSRQIYKCLLTVEAISYFLTLSEMPCDMQHIQDAHFHPLLWGLKFLKDNRMVTVIE